MEKSLETYAQLWRLYHQGSERVSRFSEYLERFWIQRELANLASSNRVRPILAVISSRILSPFKALILFLCRCFLTIGGKIF